MLMYASLSLASWKMHGELLKNEAQDIYSVHVSLLLIMPYSLSLSLSSPPLSKVDHGLVLRVIPFLSYMMDDTSINVIKRLLVCVLHVYKLAFTVSQLHM